MAKIGSKQRRHSADNKVAGPRKVGRPRKLGNNSQKQRILASKNKMKKLVSRKRQQQQMAIASSSSSSMKQFTPEKNATKDWRQVRHSPRIVVRPLAGPGKEAWKRKKKTPARRKPRWPKVMECHCGHRLSDLFDEMNGGREDGDPDQTIPTSLSKPTITDDELAEMDRLMMAKHGFGRAEVAVTQELLLNECLDDKPVAAADKKKPVENRAAETAQNDLPSTNKREGSSSNGVAECQHQPSDQQSAQETSPSSSNEIPTASASTSVLALRPQFEEIATELGLQLREECQWLVFLCLDGPDCLIGRLLCFRDTKDGTAVCVDEYRDLKRVHRENWQKTVQQQFIDSVFGRCVRFFPDSLQKSGARTAEEEEEDGNAN